MAHPTAAITVLTKRRSRVALRVRSPHGLHPSNLAHDTGQYHRVRDNAGRVLYSRSDRAAPFGGFVIADNPVATPGTGITDTAGRLAVDHRNTLHVAFARSGTAGADGVYTARSNDDGQTWEAAELAITGGTHPALAVGPGGTKILAAYVGGNIKAQVQHPGDSAPGAAITLTDGTGTALSVADDSFGLDQGYSGQAGWVLHCLIAGETDTSEWVSYAESVLSFTRVT